MDNSFFSDYAYDFLIGFYSYEKEIVISLLSIFGVFVGSLITFIGGLITKKSETKFKVIEKFIDKKLEAFEKLNIFINDLRTVNQYNFTGEKIYRYPIAFHSVENLTQLKSKLFEILSNSIWYSSKVIRELNFLQDYFVTLQVKIQDVPNEKMKTVGRILWTDFIALSSKLDEMNKEFFVEEIANLKYKPSKTWHKYKRPETEKRLQSMKLMQSDEQIQLLKVGG
ncbi:MAG: hypothetical protein IPH52_18000 [Leptospiraceae bacterium]|nr:hypothetical protein [Leptospiraceae bacterium]